MNLRPLLVAVAVLMDTSPLFADQPAAVDQSLLQRIDQLEAETKLLRTELSWSRERLERLPPVQADPVSFQESTDEEWMSYDELWSMMLDAAWTKGDFKIVPYGSLWGSMIYAAQRNSPGPYTLYIPSATFEGEDSYTIDTRRTRVGLDITGPRVPLMHCAESGGQIEIDFHGSFAVENKPGVLLRHAYGEVKDDNFRLLAGQTWDIISPLNPGTLSYSVGWGGGNIGYRRAQVRLERYLHPTDNVVWTLQGSINQDIVSDGGAQGESAGWPVVQARTAVTLKQFGPCGLPATLGVSGHIGNQGFDFTAPFVKDDGRVRTWSLNLDIRMPITENFGVQGELFTGQNLGTFLGGVVQGVNLTTHRGIRSSGGWFDVWYDIGDRWHTHAGYGLDDPVNIDLTAGGRTYNQILFANVSFDITKKMVVGFELSSWKTLYQGGLRPGNSVQFEFMGKYGF